MSDIVIRGGTVATDGLPQSDISIENGSIKAIGSDLPGATEEIDARGKHIFPGIIDVHLHFNEPGRTEWEGAATGSRAFAAGGGTLYFDMPLNSTPCTINAREFDRKCAALSAASITDFALWGGLVPGNLPELAELASRGVIGFKAFMCDSGLPEFPHADDLTLLEGLREAARLGLPVAVHAESQELTQALRHRMLEENLSGIRAFLDSRPIVAETEAIQRATWLAGQAKAKLHIVHVSSGRGVVMAAEARARGVDVSIETCPHYLYFTEDDVERLGAVAKCAPPLREKCEQNSLWAQLLSGNIDIVGSDHSPSPPEMKSGDFDKAWGGIAGVQSTLAVLLDRGHHARGLSLETISDLLAGNPATRFRIANKGRLVPGADADLAIVDVSKSFDLHAEDLMQRHRFSPYIGARFRGAVERTIRRGETIFNQGKITARNPGVLVRPD